MQLGEPSPVLRLFDQDLSARRELQGLVPPFGLGQHPAGVPEGHRPNVRRGVVVHGQQGPVRRPLGPHDVPALEVDGDQNRLQVGDHGGIQRRPFVSPQERLDDVDRVREVAHRAVGVGEVGQGRRGLPFGERAFQRGLERVDRLTNPPLERQGLPQDHPGSCSKPVEPVSVRLGQYLASDGLGLIRAGLPQVRARFLQAVLELRLQVLWNTRGKVRGSDSEPLGEILEGLGGGPPPSGLDLADVAHRVPGGSHRRPTQSGCEAEAPESFAQAAFQHGAQPTRFVPALTAFLDWASSHRVASAHGSSGGGEDMKRLLTGIVVMLSLAALALAGTASFPWGH